MCGDKGRGSDACVDVNMSKILAILETFFFSRSPILILKIVSRMGDIFDILAPPRGFITHRYVPPHLLSIQDPFKTPSLVGSLLIVVWTPSYYLSRIRSRSLASGGVYYSSLCGPLTTIQDP